MGMSDRDYNQQSVTLSELEALLGMSTGCEAWPQPEALGDALPPVAPMLPEMIPFSLRPAVIDVTQRMQTPLDFAAVAAVATLAGLVGRRAFIQPKELDTSWRVVPNLWGGIVAAPGSMKSPAINAWMTTARELERDWLKDYESEMQLHEQAVEEAALALNAWKSEVTKAHKGGGPVPSRPAQAPDAPARKRLLTQDATFESLHVMLADNPGGIFVSRDELTGWFAQLERSGHEQERGFYLEAWNGDLPYTIDRVSRGSIRVEHTCVSLFGGIQPSRLRHYLADALSGGPSNDGLMQRFQLLVWPDAVRADWSWVDRLPDSSAQQRACEVYRRVAAMDPLSPVLFRFDTEAQQLFIAWLTHLERRLQSPAMTDVMKAHLAKYRSLMPSLALLFALADGCEGVVELAHAQLAASWCAYLETHAERVYSAQSSPAQAAAISLAQRLLNGELGQSTFSLRKLYQKHWSGLASPEEARSALGYLEELGWVRAVAQSSPKTGRKSESYAINPRLEARHAEC